MTKEALMAKHDPKHREYLIEKANDAYEVEQLLTAIRLGLAASGLNLDGFNLLLNSATQKLRFVGSALTEEANRGFTC